MISFLKNVKLTQRQYAFKDYASAILSELEWFKLVTTLALVFKSENKTKYDNFYSSLKAGIIINENNIDDLF